MSHSSGGAYNCTKTTAGARYTFNGATGNFLLAIYGFQGLWATEFQNITITKSSGSGTLTQRFSMISKFPQNSGWQGDEASTLYFYLYQVSNAQNMSITIAHSQANHFRVNGAVTFLR